MHFGINLVKFYLSVGSFA